MKSTSPLSFWALVQASILGEMLLWEWEKQPFFYCTHYKSSLQTNHVLEIEPEEECWAWILLCSTSPSHFSSLFPFISCPSFSHPHFVLRLYSVQSVTPLPPAIQIGALLLFLAYFLFLLFQSSFLPSFNPPLPLLTFNCWAREWCPSSSSLDCLLSHTKKWIFN